MSENRPFDESDDLSVVRREEQLEAVTAQREAGRVRIRKVLDEQPFDDQVLRGIEHAEVEREPAAEADSGQVETP